MDAKRCKIPQRTARNAVTQPVMPPAIIAIPVAIQGLMP
ncbi:hypothetical protein D046_9367, partial [Vibrio parahaemolyticus V-223/04]